MVAVLLAASLVVARSDEADVAAQKPAADEAREDDSPPAEKKDAEKIDTETKDTEKPAEEKSTEKPAEEPSGDEPAATGTGVPTRMPMIGRFGRGWLWNNQRKKMAMPPNLAEEKEGDEGADTPRGIVLADNGEIRRRLEKIRGEISDEHFADAARHLGHLLQNAEVRDFFLSHDADRRDGRGFRAEVRRLIAALPAEGRAAYRAQFEAVARQQLNRAIASGGESELRDVAQRFPSTKAGCEALYRLGRFLWDHGRPEAAASCLERLRTEPDAADFEPAVSVLLAASLLRGNQPAKFRAVIRELDASELLSRAQLAGRPLADLPRGERALAAFSKLLGAGEATVPDEARDWLVFRGDPDRNRVTNARLPHLSARWTRALTGDPQTQLSIERAAVAHREGGETHVPLLHPLAVGKLVLMRTARGVAAFDLETGRPLWRSPTGDDSENAGIDHRLWREPAGGTCAADAQCVYLVEGLRVAEGSGVVGATGVLSAHEHFQGREGRLRWRVGGIDGGSEPALAGVSFLGPPLPWQGRLYVEFEHRGAISVAELDARSGTLQWQEELAHVDESVGDDPIRKLAGATPSISVDEIMICPTSGGAVVAVDLVTRSLLWAYRYKCRPPTGIVPDADFEGPGAIRADQRERWLDGAVTIDGDCVVLSPPESTELHCLDLRDGHPRWTAPRGDGLYVAGITDEAVVVVGRAQVRALRRADGQPAWNAPVTLPASVLTSGRGVTGRDGYFLPTTNGSIFLINLKTGSVLGEIRSAREIALGNLVWHDGSLLSLGPDYLQAFDEREAVERQVRERLERNPADAAAILWRGELELAAGRLDTALAAFRQAHALAPSGRTRSRLTSALLDALRQQGPNRNELSRELDLLAEQR
jgi:outer membrane protein assembly factor BamB